METSDEREEQTASTDPSQSSSDEERASAQSTSSTDPLTVVGIGASAGGLSALRSFFSAVPAESGVAYVVVVHLSPDHESHLADLLQSSAKMPTIQVQQTTALRANHVYVIPPGSNIEAVDTHLRLSELEERRVRRLPVDHFFRTLAATHDGHSLGVVLTGTGSDGTLGLREIRQQGGITIVQDPSDAEYDGMPRSAIANGSADIVLPLREIPGRILDLVGVRPQLPVRPSSQKNAELRTYLQQLFALISEATGRDYSTYKETTLLRRIARRMQFNRLEDPSAYITLLRERPQELQALSDDLVISVTSFFRDEHVFSALASSIIPQLFEDRPLDEPFRIWSVGCATGEEAYSLAILFLEEAERRGRASPLQVFATDLHAQALDKAREGRFPEDIEADVSAERLARFFHKERGGYRIRNEVKEHVLFTPHNLLTDPPFSRLDLVSCRNFLIYIQRETQRKIIELFHYVLKPGGQLVLGTSETHDAADLFGFENKSSCVYAKRNIRTPEPRLPVFPLTFAAGQKSLRADRSPDPLSYDRLHQELADPFIPSSLLLTPQNKVAHISARAGRYFVHPDGEPTTDVFKLILPELRSDLRFALSEARETDQPKHSPALTVEMGGKASRLVLHVRPATDAKQKGFALVVFFELSHDLWPSAILPQEGFESGEPSGAEDEQSVADRQISYDEHRAERELSHQRMQAVLEEYETAQEELRASNEELQSANEELRATMEELETSKEELQSMNEELQTMNQENRRKVEDLAELSGDLQNLLSATSIATLFLDRRLNILRFTPMVGELFNVRESDKARPISDITHRLGYSELREDALSVLDDLVPVERIVHDEKGLTYLTRIHPYRSVDDRIAGVVITFIDITNRAQMEEALRVSEAKYRTLFSSIDEGFCVLHKVVRDGTFDFTFVEYNPAFGAHLGLDTPLEKTTLREAFPAEDADWFDVFLRASEGSETSRVERKLSTGRAVELFVFPAEEEGQQLGVLVRDITERKRVDENLKRSEEFSRLAVEAGQVGTWGFEPVQNEFYISSQMATLLGQNPNRLRTSEERWHLTLSEEEWWEAIHPEDRLTVKQAIASTVEKQVRLSCEFRVLTSGESRWLSANGGMSKNGSGVKLRGAAVDITPRKEEEARLREQEEGAKRELLAMTNLHQLVNKLLLSPDLAAALDEVLSSAIEITGADKGYVQLLDESERGLETVAHRGFSAEMIERFVVADLSGPSRTDIAGSPTERLIIEDVTAGQIPESYRDLAQLGDFRGMQRTPLFNRKGKFVGALSTHYLRPYQPTQAELFILDLYARQASEIIERKYSEDALRQSEAEFRAMFEVSGVAAIQLQSSGEMRNANQTFCEMIGYAAPELVGKNFADFMHPADAEEASITEVLLSSRGTYQSERRLCRRDGSSFWGLVTANIVPHFSPPQAIVLVLDVTARREAELSLAQENRHKDEFLAMLGHELRNPLAAIRSATEVLKLSSGANRAAEHSHGVLSRQSKHMARLIDGLLEISRIARGKLFIDPQVLDLRAVIEPVLDDRSSEMAAAGLSLVCRISDEPLWIRGDHVRLTQVFDNLLGNAIKFTPGPGTITVAVERDQAHAVVWVCDTGVGLRPGILRSIFEAFQQEDQDVARTAGGLGLGLALTKGLVDLHSGSIVAHSKGPGEGSEFEVRLPLVSDPAPSSMPPPPSTLGVHKILVVEDNMDAAEMLTELLRLRGHQVTWVENGKQALVALEDEHFDVVLCDLGLPGMDGFEVASAIRNQEALQEVTLVALTGYGQPQDKEKALRAGFHHHLVKPIELSVLEEVLATVGVGTGRDA